MPEQQQPTLLDVLRRIFPGEVVVKISVKFVSHEWSMERPLRDVLAEVERLAREEARGQK